MIRRILLPLDGSQTSEAILPQLQNLLRRIDCEVVVLSVINDPVPFGPMSIDNFDLPELTRVREEAARGYVTRVTDRLIGEGISTRGLIAFGPPALNILDTARREEASLIAMSTHGHSGFTRWILGSVTEQVLRACTVPLLVMRSFEETDDGSWSTRPAEPVPFERILVPVDGSETALCVVPWVAELTAKLEASVELLSVAPPFPGDVKVIQAQTALKSASDLFAAREIRVEPTVRQGEPSAVIAGHAVESGAGLIAMATHGRSGIARWTLGSVTEKVLRRSTLPVLVIPSGK